MPFLLIVFLTLACLPEIGVKGEWPPPFGNSASDPAFSALLTWLAVALLIGWAWWTVRRACRALRHNSLRRERALRRYERMRWAYQFALFGMYILVMCAFGWGWAVGQLWSRPDGSAGHGAELLVLAPFLAAMVGAWLCFYDADRAAFVAAHSLSPEPLLSSLLENEQPSSTFPLSQSGPAFGSRWSYILFKIRSTLILVMIPLALLLGQKEVFRTFPDFARAWGQWLAFLGFVVALAVFMTMPWIVRLVLNLKPLPEGGLRRHLWATAKRMNFRCNDILVWNTQGGMANAMMVGILPWLRYVVFTDRLLEEFTEEEVEAVFGHEMGHVMHHHMLYYFSFFVASFLVLGWWVDSLNLDLFGLGQFLEHTSHRYLQNVPMMVLVLAYVFVVFGFISRRCERQADIYGCRAVSCSRRNCTTHDLDAVLMERGQGLCATGVRVFIGALDKVALVNGINRERPGFLQSWQHSTIARRVGFLRRMLNDPFLEPRFQRRLLGVKCGIFVILAVVLTVLGLRAWAQPAEQNAAPGAPAAAGKSNDMRQ